MKKKRDSETEAALEVVKADKLREEIETSQALKARKKLLEPYTDGLPYDRDRVIGEAKKQLYQSFTSAIECGKYLIWLREEEGVHAHGLLINKHFSHMRRSTLFNFMRLARVAVEHPKLQHLAEKQRSKAIALLENLDEEDLREFEKTDSIAGMTLDEVEKMPWRQLKDELRKEKRKNERGREQLRDSEEKVAQLRQEMDALKNPKVYTSEEEKYLDIIKDLGMRYEYILLDIRSKIAYHNGGVPDAVLKKLYYLLLYIQKETLEERLRVAEHYGGADDIPWEVDDSELPPADELHKELPHFKGIVSAREKRAKKGKRG